MLSFDVPVEQALAQIQDTLAGVDVAGVGFDETLYLIKGPRPLTTRTIVRKRPNFDDSAGEYGKRVSRVERVIIQGALSKRPSKKWQATAKGWKEKWFVLTGSHLCYYDSEADRDAGKPHKKSIPTQMLLKLRAVDNILPKT